MAINNPLTLQEVEQVFDAYKKALVGNDVRMLDKPFETMRQLSMSWLHVDGAPVGASLIGGCGCDEIVLQAARALQYQLSDSLSQMASA